MLEITFKLNGKKIAVIEAERIGSSTTEPSDLPGEFADYRIKYLIERGDASGMHNRMIYGFPRRYYNVFALCLQALNALNEKDLKLERDYDIDADEAEAPVSTDLARRFHPTLREIQRWLR